MKIILLTNNQSNQIALANKIHNQFPISAIVIERKKAGLKKRTFKNVLERIMDRTVFFFIRNSWIRLLDYYKKNFPDFPQVRTLVVENVNSIDVILFLKEINPDLVFVSGTSLLKKDILALNFPIGIINLHTGLSPYIKGGPNCTNWCIATQQYHLIGNTIMWIDGGIDSGDLIATEIVQFKGNETLLEVHLKVMEGAHELVLAVLKYINANSSTGNFQRVKQNTIAKGVTYYNRNWSFKKKLKFVYGLMRFKSAIKSSDYTNKLKNSKAIPIGN